MKVKNPKLFKCISLSSLLIGIAIWIWYVVSILILHKTPYGDLLFTIPIGIIGVIAAKRINNKKLINLNIIQTLSFPLIFLISMYIKSLK